VRPAGVYAPAATPEFAALVAASTPDRQVALTPLVARVTLACTAYDAAEPDVHALGAVALTKAQKATLIDGYDNRTVEMKRLLGEMLDTLPAANRDLCPYCSLDTNPELDHFLPKAKYPEFSLHARNLFPICGPCNRRKLNRIRSIPGGERYFLYPRSEPAVSPVLEAELTFAGARVRVAYRVDGGAAGLAGPALAQVTRHYDALKLAGRYAKRAHAHLASVKADLRGRPQAVVERLLASLVATAAIGEPPNGWKPALFRAVAAAEAHTVAWLLAP
jgi:hypothetical protein